MHHGVAKFYTIDSLPSKNIRNVWLILKARTQVCTHTHRKREKWLDQYGLSYGEGLYRIVVSNYFYLVMAYVKNDNTCRHIGET